MKVILMVLYLTPLALLATNSFADTLEEVRQAEIINKKSYDMYNKLRCIVCQGQTLAESEAEVSKIIKQAIREKLVNGQTEEEILAWLSDKYGDYIFLDPKFNKQTWPLWIVPIITIILLLVITTVFITRKNGKV